MKYNQINTKFFNIGNNIKHSNSVQQTCITDDIWFAKEV